MFYDVCVCIYIYIYIYIYIERERVGECKSKSVCKHTHSLGHTHPRHTITRSNRHALHKSSGERKIYPKFGLSFSAGALPNVKVNTEHILVQCYERTKLYFISTIFTDSNDGVIKIHTFRNASLSCDVGSYTCFRFANETKCVECVSN